MLLHWFFPQEISFLYKIKILVFIIGFINCAASLLMWEAQTKIYFNLVLFLIGVN